MLGMLSSVGSLEAFISRWLDMLCSDGGGDVLFMSPYRVVARYSQQAEG
jgi:hypothetical protein